MICDSPCEIYHHALPFCPSTSWLHECYSLELSQEVVVVKGLQAKWGTCYHIVPFDYSAGALACWNDIVAVGLGSGDIKILDAITGICTSALSGHTEAIRSVTFSSNGTLLVSESNDRTVKLWDIQIGGVVKTFYGHTRRVASDSISPDHTITVSGSLDKILIWGILTGEQLCAINTQDIGTRSCLKCAFITSVNFSPTTSQISISMPDCYHTVQ